MPFSPDEHSIEGLALVTKVASLDERMLGLEKNVINIGTAVSNLGSKIDQRSETPWASIWAACGVVLTVLSIVGWMAMAPIKDSLTDHSSLLREFGHNFMAREDIKDLFKASSDAIKEAAKGAHDDLEAYGRSIDRRAELSNARRDDYQKMADKRSQDNTDRITRLEEHVVRRGEHEEHWKADAAAFSNQQRQIDELRGRLNDMVPARDFLKDLHDQLRDTQRELWRREAGPK